MDVEQSAGILGKVIPLENLIRQPPHNAAARPRRTRRFRALTPIIASSFPLRVVRSILSVTLELLGIAAVRLPP